MGGNRKVPAHFYFKEQLTMAPETPKPEDKTPKASETPKPEDKTLKAPVAPTTQEPTESGGSPDSFKTRFRPTFDPHIGIFKCTKRIPCEGGVYLVGDYIYPNDEKIDGRRLRLLFSQRYLDYPTNEDIEKFWNDPEHRKTAKKVAAQNVLDEAETEKKYNEEIRKKAVEEAKKFKANRAGVINRIHDERG